MEFQVFLVSTVLVTFNAHRTVQQTGKLTNGPTPYEGRVEMLTEEYGWMPVCDEHWNMSDADVVCRDIGYMEGAMSHDSPRTGDVTISTSCVVNVSCEESSTTFQECSHDISNDCNDCYQAKATCNFYGYYGCYNFNDCDNNIWTGHDNMTIQYCVEFCRNNDTSVAMLTGARMELSECICRDLNSTCDVWSNVSNAKCNQVCSGANWQICGGGAYHASVYDVQMGACGGEYHNQTGTIYSPYFPGYYKTEEYCEWSIVSQEHHISIRFTIFDLANDDDYVNVTENYQGEERILGNFSRTFPASREIYSCSSGVLIVFLANDGENQNGTFALDFSGRMRCDNHSEVVNGTITTDSVCPYRTGDIATVVCNPGYETNSSHQSVECQDGIWNDTLPQCVERIQTTTTVPSTGPSEEFISTELQTTASTSDTSELSIGLIFGVTIGVTGLVVLVIVLTLLLIRRRRKADLRNKGDAISSVDFVEDTVPTGSTGRENHQYETIDDKMIGNTYEMNPVVPVTSNSDPSDIVRNDQLETNVNNSFSETGSPSAETPGSEANIQERLQSGFVENIAYEGADHLRF
ncbi:scavenger receptor cysteine-rich domain-containing protein DMBT1-like [Ptychodera flava]|uniref:scavenger receptor cysteine-rich domain-containing protein DMBT1-like n=1 Tax=Ptychodera flava TaxID=63121 RepID=UPI00396AB07B